jgi:enterochelin esterase-like enzyme
LDITKSVLIFVLEHNVNTEMQDASQIRKKLKGAGVSMSELHRQTILRGLNGGKGYSHRAVCYCFDGTAYRTNAEILELAETLIEESQIAAQAA